MRDDYWTLSFPRLTQDDSGDFYPDTKDDTMTTDQPTSPLPDLSRWHLVPVPAVIPAGTTYAFVKTGGSWGIGEARYDYQPNQRWGWEYYTEHPIPDPNAWATDRIGLWSDTPPTPIDPADIQVGMRVRRVWETDGPTISVEGTVNDIRTDKSISIDGWNYQPSDGCDWLLIADAPDPAAHWIRAIAEATPETAATVYAAIKGEQA